MSGLRRADWRFLLPAPMRDRFQTLVLLGADPELAAGLAGFAGAISTDPEDIGAADLVVAMAGAGQPLEGLVARARKDAVLYAEIDRRRTGRRTLTPSRARRLLERAGFRVVGLHWAVPDFEHARRHIPLDMPAALAWYLTTLQTAGSRLARVADAGVRLLARAGPGALASLVPCYAVTAVGRARTTGSGGVLTDGASAVAMLTSGQDDGSRVVLLPFGSGAAVPSHVVKVSRLASFDGHTEREQRTLEQLRQRLPPRWRESLPEPLGLSRWNGLLVARESHAPGTPVVVSTGRYGGHFAPAREDLRRVVDWLIDFHAATRVRGGWCDEVVRRTVSRLDACGSLFPDASPAADLLRGAVVSARLLVGQTLPIVPLHHDLGPWNIHREGARLTVIDWESGDGDAGQRNGPGAYDLFYFLTYWYLRARHLRRPAEERRGVRRLFAEPASDPAARAVHEELERYRASMGMDSRFLPVLLVGMWSERALDRVERARMAGPQGAAAGANRYAGYLEELAGRGRVWFGEHRWP